MDAIKLCIEIIDVMKVWGKDLTEKQIKRGLANKDICPTQKELKKAVNYLEHLGSIQNIAKPIYHLADAPEPEIEDGNIIGGSIVKA
jgi:hypothetical protein